MRNKTKSTMKGVTKLARRASLASQKCGTCPMRLHCTPAILRVCHDAFVEGFKKGVKAVEKGTKENTLKNFRKICGCYYEGTCTVDCKECTFRNCETLTDLFNIK
ncbi:hypothetical protein D0T87_04850 [Bacteroides sp. 51]|nr:hypothetical protein [Bacteroides sp. 51]